MQAYDALIKSWVDGDAATEQSGVIFRTILFDDDNIYFYHKADAQRSTEPYDVADVTVPLAGTEVTKALAQISAIVTALGGTMAATAPYTVTFPTLTTEAKNSLVAAINELDAAIDVLNGNDTTAGSVAKSIKDAIAALDTVSDVITASQSGKAITITGSIKEEDGVIVKGTASDITLADVASTGVAEDVTTTAITDGKVEPSTLYAAGDVQGILEAIARDLNDLESESVVTVEKQATAETGYISTYVIKQNDVQVGEKINIPKDYLVKSATVETVTTADDPYQGAEVGDKYIDFVINVKEGTATDEHIYLPLDDLMAAISGGTNAEATVSIDAHNVITVTINKIAASKIAYSNTTSGSAVEETVQAALARIDGGDTVAGSIKKAVKDGIEALDGSATIASVSGEVITIKGGVTEADGVVDNDSSDDVTISPIATASINALFATTP